MTRRRGVGPRSEGTHEHVTEVDEEVRLVMARQKKAAGRRFPLECSLIALAAACLWPRAASAADPPPAPDAAVSVPQCVAAHTTVQELRKKHLLLQARETLKGCLSQQCPALVRNDCYAWTDELEKETPSVIFNVTGQSAQLVDPRVVVDGAPVEVSTSGAALRLDPGRHAYRVEYPGYKPIARDFVVFAGQHFLQLNVELEPLVDPKAPSAPTRPPPTETYRPVPAATYVFLAIGLAGGASLAGFGAAGLSAQHNLESTCSPRCTDAQVTDSGVRWKYLAADVSMGVGIAGLVASGLTALLRPTKERPVTVSVVPGPTGVFGAVVLRGM